MKIDGVFSGGGVKAYAFIGSLESIENNNLQFARVAGTSAGAIIAALIAAGYPSKEIKNLLDDIDLQQFADPPKITKLLPFSKWFFLYFQLGINRGNKLEKWLYNQLAKKNVFTFNDLKPEYLKVVVSDLSLGKLVIIPDDLDRVYGISGKYFPVAKAVRMSAGFPYFFMPKKLPGKNTNKKSIIVDGGLLSNFPLWIFDKGTYKRDRPILGVKLTTSMEGQQPQQIKNALHMFQALFSTMKKAHDTRYISTSDKQNIIFIPVEDIGTTDFTINKAAKDNLIETGISFTDSFLNSWPK
ncbi:patatin-like phospholipase family protein [Virgibacillus sp. YIM 98842]|uniref:patatin-like phospholipase family protein n=1 Tax=Virgibacillus sp. YIM 98842 TaxID=2663533 RepID=UPI0013DA9D50|nr:patatin-like phospholipase family protein [Virgibacillus sp. YIM 98842]